jgi:hypothetical protein
MYTRISFDAATWKTVAKWASKARAGFQVGVCKDEDGKIFCGMIQSKTVKYTVGPKRIKKYAFEGGEWVLVKTMMRHSEALFDMFTPPPKKPTSDANNTRTSSGKLPTKLPTKIARMGCSHGNGSKSQLTAHFRTGESEKRRLFEFP